MNKKEDKIKLEERKDDYEYKFVTFCRRKDDEYFEMVISYPTERCYTKTLFYCDRTFDIKQYICKENEGFNYPSQLFFYFDKENLDIIEDILFEVTGRKFSDLKSKYSNKKATPETIFKKMLPETKFSNGNVFTNQYEFD